MPNYEKLPDFVTSRRKTPHGYMWLSEANKANFPDIEKDIEEYRLNVQIKECKGLTYWRVKVDKNYQKLPDYKSDDGYKYKLLGGFVLHRSPLTEWHFKKVLMEDGCGWFD